MDIFKEESEDVSKLPDAKAAIIHSLRQLGQWRENQLQKIKNKHFIEQEKFLQQSRQQQENLGKFLLDRKGISLKNDTSLPATEKKLESIIVSQDESSLSGHMMRCFSDSSNDNSVLNLSKEEEITKSQNIPGNKEIYESPSTVTFHSNSTTDLSVNDVHPTSKKPKRKYLRKRSGLSRYMPKQKTSLTETEKAFEHQENDSNSSSSLKLKPALIQVKQQTKKMNHVQFNEPVHFDKLNLSENVSDDTPSDKNVTSMSSIESSNDIPSTQHQKAYYCDTSLDEKFTKETKELAEFEMLENYTQNSSFNSDSSIVQRVLNGETSEILQPKVLHTNEFAARGRYLKTPNGAVSTNYITNVLSKCMKDVQTKKMHIQNLMSDINPRINALQRKITVSSKSPLEDEDNAKLSRSSPVDNLTDPPSVDPTQIRNVELSENAISEFSKNPTVSRPNEITECSDFLKKCQDSYQNKVEGELKNFSAEDLQTLTNEIGNVDEASTWSVKLKDKMTQLEKEIGIYQDLNAHLEKEIRVYQDHNSNLATIRKERDEVLKKLKREKDEIQKHKEEVEKKLKEETEKSQQQLKRQQETFARYQKLKSDCPGKKEREELAALRREVDKLQEELKRQRIKFASDNKRMKNQLIAAEKERDCLKLSNITLEEQCQDLLVALKTRTTKKKKVTEISEKEDGVKEESTKNKKSIKPSKHGSKNIKNKNTMVGVTSNQEKSRVRFNLSQEMDTHLEEHLEPESESEVEILPERNSADNQVTDQHLQNDVREELILETPLYEEITNGDKIERIYLSGERETLFANGTARRVSADGGAVTTLFHNGDVREVLPDGRRVYRYAASGTVETSHPGGLRTTEFADGQVQRRHADGTTEVQFPDGTVQYLHPSGAEEVFAPDGAVMRVEEDGTETVEFANGEREVRTSAYKRREFPDGSVKILYPSGRQETRYSNGRIRIKDKDGKLVVDTFQLRGLLG